MPIKVRLLKHARSLSHSYYHCLNRVGCKRKEKACPTFPVAVNLGVGRLFSEFSLWVMGVAGEALGPGGCFALWEETPDCSLSPFCSNVLLNTWLDIFKKGSTFSCLLLFLLPPFPPFTPIPPTLTLNFSIIGEPGANFLKTICWPRNRQEVGN